MPEPAQNEDAEAAVARALGRSLARQHIRDNLQAIGIVLAGALVIYAFALVLKRSYYLVMAAQLTLPWVLYVLLARKGPVGVFLAWMLSALGIYFLTGFFGYAFMVDRTRVLAAACAVGVMLLAVIAMHRPEMLSKSAGPLGGFVYCFLVIYSYSGIFEVNCLFDRSPVVVYQPVVLKKSWGLLVQPWSPDQRLNPASLLIMRGSVLVPAPREVFRSAHVGRPICVLQRKGRLGMSWCTAQTGSWDGRQVALGPWGGAF